MQEIHETTRDRDDLRAKVIADPQYSRCRSELLSFLSRSRTLRQRPRDLLELQADMTGALRIVQESKRSLEGDLARYPLGDPAGVGLEVPLAVAKRLAYVIKEIGDGIAWRALNYDRPVIRQLARKPQTGYIELDSAVQEFTAAAEHWERTGDVVVMNDLTNFFRHGDYTCIRPGLVTIVECKGGQAARRARRAKRQRRRLDEVLEFVNTGTSDTEGGSEVLLRQSVTARSHLATVAELIREARQKGAAYARLSHCLAVDVHYVELLAEMSDPRKMESLFHNPFRATREAFMHHSLDLFEDFSANVAPRSIYPFSDEDCVDVMRGDVWLISYFSYRNLARCFKKRGLLARLPTEAQLEAYLAFPRGERKHHQDLVAMRIGRPGDPAQLLTYPDTAARLFAEFLDEESFVDGVEDVLSREDFLDPQKSPIMFHPGFANEAALWD